jgi:hypothetical protein
MNKMDDITVTNTKVLKFNTKYETVANAATETVANTAQKFIITPDKGDEKTIIRITVGPTNGAVAYSVAAGDFWQGIAALTGSAAQAKTTVIELESAKYMKADGTIVITFTPATGKILLTDHALSVEVDSLV